MADGLAALEGGDWSRARAAFELAATLDPASGEPAAGLTRVAAAEGRQQIDQHRARALDEVEAEAWRQAVAEYQAALAIDPTLSFARAGLDRAERRAELSEQLDFHLGSPGRLSAPAVLAEAQELLERAREIDRPGPRLLEQMADLKELTSGAQATVAVSLRSDGLTEVTVYRVGRLGTFERRELELRPGTYTVVGSRSGYRDVRRQLEVEAGKELEPLEVRCEERI